MEEKKSKLSPRKKKWLIRVLIVVLVALAFFIGRAYQQDYLEEKIRTIGINSLSPTAKITWRTYTDTNNKLTLQYPSDWQIVHSDKDFVITKKGSSKTNITFYLLNNPKANITIPPSGVTQTIAVGKNKVVFADYFTGIGNPSNAYVQTKTLPIGGHIGAIGITIDGNTTKTDAQTVKTILGSVKTI